MEEILFLEPVFKHNIWGGTKLQQEFGYEVYGDDIGECWGISAHENGDCLIRNGKYKGKSLSCIWREHPELFGCRTENTPFPILVKLIDAKDDLSIQVHPDDSYAKCNEHGSFGKAECWYILSCDENASIILGHNAKDMKELKASILSGEWKQLLRKIPVKKGDVIPIEPGTIHAINGGVMLLEIQQSSDITYRIYDYDRLWNGFPRELHLIKGLDVIKVPDNSSVNNILHEKADSGNRVYPLYQCKYFQINKMIVNGTLQLDKTASFFLCSVLSGEGFLQGQEVKKGDHLIITNMAQQITLSGEMELIMTNV